MRTIHKFAVLARPFDLRLPKGAKVLTVQIQHGRPEMWVLLDTNNERERRTFVTLPTGNEIPDDINLDYIGTFQLDGGSLVFHLFEARG